MTNPERRTHLYILHSTAIQRTYSWIANRPWTSAFAPSECSAFTCARIVPTFNNVETGCDRSRSEGMSSSSTSPGSSSPGSVLASIERMAGTVTAEGERIGAGALGVKEGVVAGDADREVEGEGLPEG